MIGRVLGNFAAAAGEIAELAAHHAGGNVRRRLDELAIGWLLGRRGLPRARAEALLEHVVADVPGARLELRF